MPTEAVDTGLSDQELFDQANADEAPADEVVAEAPAAEPEQAEQQEQPEQSGQPRDEQGRFAAQAADAGQAAANPPAGQTAEENAGRVPSYRLKEEAEARRRLETDLANERVERAALKQRLEALERPAPKVEQPKVEKPDPLLDPEGYEAYLESKFEERILNNHREASLAQAHRTYKGEFEEAYAAAQKQVDPALKARMQQSRDPGETLMEWHRERKTMAEVGTDPNAFFQKKLDAWLADPANQAKVIEKARGGAQQQLQPGQPRQAPPVSLPPSLTRATNASADVSADDDDISDAGLWRHSNA